LVANLEQDYDVLEQDDLFDEVAEERPFWDAGKYYFRVASITRSTEPSRFENARPNNIWEFEVFYDENLEPVRLEQDGQTVCKLRQYISTSMTPGSRGRPLIEAIVGKRLDDGDTVGKSQLIGKCFTGMISNEAPKDNPRGKKSAKLLSPEKFVAPRSRPTAPRMQAPAPQRRAVEEQVEDLPF
jgi:hypothetical protein